MSWTFNQRISVVAGVLLIFFLVLFGSVSYFKMKFYVEKEAAARQLNIVKSLQIDINGWMQPSMRQVRDVAQELETQSPFIKESVIPILARSKKAINAVQVYFGLQDGRMMYDTGKELSRDWYDPRSRPWYIEGLDANTTVISEPFVGFASNQLTVTIMAPVVVNQEKQGVVAASFYVNKLYRKLKAIPIENGCAFIVDAQGKIIMHPDKSMINRTLQEQNTASKKMYEYIVSHKNGTYDYEFEGAKELIAFGELCNGWFSVVSAENGRLYAFNHNMLKLYWIMGSLMVLLTVMILVHMARKNSV